MDESDPLLKDSEKESLGWVGGSFVQGAAHKKDNKPCQDMAKFECYKNKFFLVAVADGHGDSRHDQSEHGARIATEVAINEMKKLLEGFDINNKIDDLIKNFKDNFPKHIGKKWKEKVEEHFHSIFPDDEFIAEILVRYGTTLLVSLAVEGKLLVGQIGDGAIIQVNKIKESKFVGVAEEKNVGGSTNSLCASNAYLQWQMGVNDYDAEDLILLCTDGLVNSFTDENQLSLFATSLSERISEFGFEKVVSSLPVWLDHYSEIGSGDDIALAMIYIKPKAIPADILISDGVPLDNPLADISQQVKGDSSDISDRAAGGNGDNKNNSNSEGKTG